LTVIEAPSFSPGGERDSGYVAGEIDLDDLTATSIWHRVYSQHTRTWQAGDEMEPVSVISLPIEKSAELLHEPIYIESLRLKDFRCFDQLELRFDQPSSLEGRWTCIAGINGAGKSSILQALGLVLLGNPLAADLRSGRLNRMRRLVSGERQRAEIQAVLRAGEDNRVIQLRLDIDEDRIVSTGGPPYAGVSPAPSWDEIRPHVVAGYGATRNLSSRVDRGNEDLSPDARRLITLFDPLSQLSGAEVLLTQQAEGGPLAPLLQNALSQVFGSELRIETGPSGIRFVVADKDHVEAIDLPDGFRAAAAWIADLCAIWCEKAPDLAGNANPGDIQAIVLIDEIDLHLHPSLQRELVPRLRRTFPKVQWIVTTHSPLVLANFDVNEIIALDRDCDGNIRQLDRQIFSFTSDEIYHWLMRTRPTGAAMEEELRKADEGVGMSPDEVAELMRTSPDANATDARKQVAEFREILKTLKRRA
jgi:hypothetical protein